MNQVESPKHEGLLFFWLSALVLGGLLFAAGVLVGHGMAPQEDCKDASLNKLDKLDKGIVLKKADENFTFPHALSESKTKSEATSKATSKAKAQKKDLADTSSKKNLEDQQNKAFKALSQKKHAEDKENNKAKTANDAKLSKGSKDSNYSIQIASFQEESQAKELAGKLRKQGLESVRHVSGEVSGKGKYYRVRVGWFTSRQKALEYMKRKKIKGLVLVCDE